MTAKTEAEWREIDQRLALEVMGLLAFDDLWNRWQPHTNREQAMMVKDAIAEECDRFELHFAHCNWHWACFWYELPDGAPSVGATGDTDAQAICLAAITWLNTQKGD